MRSNKRRIVTRYSYNNLFISAPYTNNLHKKINHLQIKFSNIFFISYRSIAYLILRNYFFKIGFINIIVLILTFILNKKFSSNYYPSTGVVAFLYLKYVKKLNVLLDGIGNSHDSYYPNMPKTSFNFVHKNLDSKILKFERL